MSDDDEPICGCNQPECPDCDGPCWRCGGEGWGIEGEDWDCMDPLWDEPGTIVRCNACNGSGKAKDVVYW